MCILSACYYIHKSMNHYEINSGLNVKIIFHLRFNRNREQSNTVRRLTVIIDLIGQWMDCWQALIQYAIANLL